MQKLDKEDIEHVANLAKLDLSREETDRFKKQLSEIVDYFEELRKVEVGNIFPTSQTTGLENVNREDGVKTESSLDGKQALSGSENTHNGYFKVPMILEGRTDY